MAFFKDFYILCSFLGKPIFLFAKGFAIAFTVWYTIKTKGGNAMTTEKALIGMSGCVDSSVAA